MSVNGALPRPTERYMRNREWICGHINELLTAHGNGWVAVDQARVLAAGPELGDVTHRAVLQAPDQDIAYQFIDDGTLIY